MIRAAVLPLSLALLAGPARADLAACAALAADAERLACYDALAAAAAGRVEGFGGADLPGFEAAAGDVLHFENRDAVMLVSLLASDGTLLRNLHIGGVGAGRHVLDRAGSYRLQIDATGGWAVWVERGGAP